MQSAKRSEARNRLQNVLLLVSDIVPTHNQLVESRSLNCLSFWRSRSLNCLLYAPLSQSHTHAAAAFSFSAIIALIESALAITSSATISPERVAPSIESR